MLLKKNTEKLSKMKAFASRLKGFPGVFCSKNIKETHIKASCCKALEELAQGNTLKIPEKKKKIGHM